MDLTLYGYWRSGTSYRTRIGLELKGLSYETVALDLRQSAQKSDTFLALNPQGLVPALKAGDQILTQSPAILEWLDEQYPQNPLLPSDPLKRAQVRALAALVGCDIHPLNNLRVLKAVRGLGAADNDWAGQWIVPGFAAAEALMAGQPGPWAFGETPGLADCYLVPQIYSARRFGVDMSAFPRLSALEAAANAHPAFIAAHPDNQPDAD
ncbi:MAG: maleylacetoacetate isomerase [Asticcacaulis sp.]